MAITANVTTAFGEQRTLYIRLNSLEASNHGVPATALFRGFLSEKAFKEGAHYVWEKSVEFKANVGKPLWSQAYAALVAQEGFPPAES